MVSFCSRRWVLSVFSCVPLSDSDAPKKKKKIPHRLLGPTLNPNGHSCNKQRRPPPNGRQPHSEFVLTLSLISITPSASSFLSCLDCHIRLEDATNLP